MTTTNPDVVQLPIGEPIPIGRLVCLVNGLVRLYDVREGDHAYRLYGISVSSAASGNVQIQTKGIVEIVGWGLLLGATYRASRNGELKLDQSSSDALFTQIVGKVVSTNKLLFNPQPLIFHNTTWQTISP